VYEGEIAFLYLTRLHGKGKAVGTDGISGDKHGTACLAVKARDGAKDKGRVPIAVSEGIGECIRKVSVRGVGRHIRRLHTYVDGLILVKKGKRKRTGDDILIAFFIFNGEGKGVSCAEDGAHRHVRTVQKNALLLAFEKCYRV